MIILTPCLLSDSWCLVKSAQGYRIDLGVTEYSKIHSLSRDSTTYFFPLYPRKFEYSRKCREVHLFLLFFTFLCFEILYIYNLQIKTQCWGLNFTAITSGLQVLLLSEISPDHKDFLHKTKQF